MNDTTRPPKLWRMTRILCALTRAERMRRMSETFRETFSLATRRHRYARAERLWAEFYAEKRNPSHLQRKDAPSTAATN